MPSPCRCAGACISLFPANCSLLQRKISVIIQKKAKRNYPRNLLLDGHTQAQSLSDREKYTFKKNGKSLCVDSSLPVRGLRPGSSSSLRGDSRLRVSSVLGWGGAAQ